MEFQVFVKGRASRRKDSVEGLSFVPSAKWNIKITLIEESECGIEHSKSKPTMRKSEVTP
jgi:hypothetical protein